MLELFYLFTWKYVLWVRASPSAHVNSSKIEKGASFTHFEQKKSILVGVKMCKNVYIYSWATVTVYIYTVTVACVFIILLIFVRTNFSLSSPCTTTSAPHLLFLRCTQTHPHKQINTETHPHTDKPTQTNQ